MKRMVLAVAIVSVVTAVSVRWAGNVSLPRTDAGQGVSLAKKTSEDLFSKPRSSPSKEKELQAKIGAVRMPFIRNEGQVGNDGVKFYARTFGGTVFVTGKGEIVYALPAGGVRPDPSSPREKSNVKVVVLQESLAGGAVKEVHGEEKSVAQVNIFMGNDPAKWKTGIPTYDTVSLGEVYEGIDMKLKAGGNNVEKLFTVMPGAHPRDIRVELKGAKGIRAGVDGKLEVETELGPVSFTKPVAYQEIGGKRAVVNVAYRVNGGDISYGFEVGEYDRRYPVTIDPLLASTFIGGSKWDYGYAVAVDPSSGAVYMAGYTDGYGSGLPSDYPVTPGAYDTSCGTDLDGTCNGGQQDIVVSKFDGSLTTLLASTFLGGGSGEYAWALALDQSGNVYVGGGSSSWDYPTTAGAYDPSHNGYGDAVISKLDGSLSTLLASTYIGGASAGDWVAALAIDPSGNVYMAGGSGSFDYPVARRSYDRLSNGGGDVVVSKLDGNLSSLLASTYLGGSVYDTATAIALNSAGNVYVVGITQSSDYPATRGALDITYNSGVSDAFVSKLDGNLTSLSASTYLGGSGYYEAAYALAVDPAGNIYVGGWASAPDFPTTDGAFDPSYNGGDEGFVSKLDSGLTTLIASTFLGGSAGGEFVSALALDSSGNVYAVGGTNSPDFPTTPGAYDRTYTAAFYGAGDVFVSKFSSSLSTLSASTFIGGDDGDWGVALAIDPLGNIYLTGVGGSDYPVTAGAYDQTFNGSSDAFVAKMDAGL